MPASRSKTKVRPAPAGGGYRKGEETRRRILTAALKEFGAGGISGATTRRIAQEATVNLPALTYYFGGKEGLYLACAREIVGEYRTHMLTTAAGVRASLDDGASPEAARAALKAVLNALVDLQIAGRQSDVWMSFVLRE
ncbi:MAG TPA: TetR family transcriptional regulator, partial [Caulobacteraceae bacterium]|nr:TetR family transcriptional regulator [Caulobacteraceae bacterium]